MKLNYKHTIFASYTGYITQAIVNNFAPLLFIIFENKFDIPLEKITLLITVNFLVQLTVDLLSAKFVDRIGYRKSIVAAHIFSAVGLAGLSIFPQIFPDPYSGLLCAVVIYAIGGGIIEVLISPIVEACPTDNKASVMSLLHSFYCWGAVGVVLISTVFMHFLGKESWTVLALIWALVPAINAFYFTQVPINTLTEDGESMPVKKLFSLGSFRIFVLLMITAGASELAMSQWASSFAESGLGISKAAGDIAGACLFAVLMGCARVFYAKFSEKIKLIDFIIGSGVLCIIAYLTAAFSPFPVVSLIGCAICGLSVGIMWPGVFSIASAKFPKGGTAMFAILALAGDLGCSSGPTLVGLVSGAFDDNLKVGLCAAVFFPLLLIILSLILKKHEKAGV